MFNIESIKKANKNFINYLNGYSNSLLIKIGECDKNIALCDVLEEIKKTHNVQTILDNREFIASLNPIVLDYFKIIEFFRDNDALDADQVNNAASKILNIDEIRNFDITKKSIYESKSSYESELSKVKSIISSKDYDIDFFNKLLLESTLSDKDKILILSSLAYESSLVKKNEEKKDKEDKESKKDRKFKKIENTYSIEELLNKYHKLSETLSMYESELEGLWKDKNDSQMEYAINISRLYNNGEVEIKDIFDRSFTSERMLVLLLCSKEYQDVIDMSLSNIDGNNTTKELYDELKYYIDSLEDRINSLNKYYKLEQSRSEEVHDDYDSSKILFLLNSDGNSLINFDSFNEEEIDKVNSLLEKSERKGKNEKTILLHKIKNVDFDVLVSKFSSFICTYVPLSDGTILVLNVNGKKKGYDEAINILNKYLSGIKEIRKEVRSNGSEKLFSEQKEYRDSLRNQYGINTSKVDEVKL